MPVTVNVEKCEGCGDCVEVCATGAITIEAEKAKINVDECCECQVCLSSCPQEAIAAE